MAKQRVYDPRTSEWYILVEETNRWHVEDSRAEKGYGKMVKGDIVNAALALPQNPPEVARPEVQDAVGSLTAAAKALEAEVEKFAAHRADSEAHLDTLSTQIVELKSNVAGFPHIENQLNKLIDKLLALTSTEDTNKVLEQQVLDCTTELKTVRVQLQAEQVSNGELREKNAKLDQQVTDLQARRGEEKAPLQAEVTRLTQELEATTRRLTEQTSRFTALRDEVNKLQGLNRDASDKNTKLAAEVQAKTGETDVAQAAQARAEGERKTAETNLNAATVELGKLRKELNDEKAAHASTTAASKVDPAAYAKLQADLKTANDNLAAERAKPRSKTAIWIGRHRAATFLGIAASMLTIGYIAVLAVRGFDATFFQSSPTPVVQTTKDQQQIPQETTVAKAPASQEILPAPDSYYAALRDGIANYHK